MVILVFVGLLIFCTALAVHARIKDMDEFGW